MNNRFLAERGFGLRFVRGDVAGGITAAVVALPLALAFGVASGAGPLAGLYGAILVGFFASLFGGTPAQVSGPTGPMTVVMAAVVIQYAHHPALAFTVVMLGGLMQIGFGLLKLGRYVTYIPFPVVAGFMTGIGSIIVILEIAPLLGHPVSSEGVFTALAQLPGVLLHGDPATLALGAIGLGCMILLPAPLRRWMPPPLFALVVVTLLAPHLAPHSPVIGPIPHGLPHFLPPQFEVAEIPHMLRSAFSLAVLGSIDSLLTSLVADNVTRTHHHSDRELVGQGIGNVASGLFGANPGAGATMRTLVNVRAGGRSPVGGMVHALVLLAAVLGLSPLVSGIPLAALAAILIHVAWQIVDLRYIRTLYRADRAELAVMLTVALLTVTVDLITAVGVGVVMASLISARELSAHQLAQLNIVSSETDAAPFTDEERQLLRRARSRVMVVHLSGPFSFCSAQDMVRRMAAVGAGWRAAVLDLTDVTLVDASVAMAIREVVAALTDNGTPVFLVGHDREVARDLERMEALGRMPAERRVESRAEGIRRAVELALDGEETTPVA